MSKDYEVGYGKPQQRGLLGRDGLALPANHLADGNLSRLHDVHLVAFLTLAKYEVAFRKTHSGTGVLYEPQPAPRREPAEGERRPQGPNRDPRN